MCTDNYYKVTGSLPYIQALEDVPFHCGLELGVGQGHVKWLVIAVITAMVHCKQVTSTIFLFSSVEFLLCA